MCLVRQHYQRLTEFDRSCIVGLHEDGWSYCKIVQKSLLEPMGKQGHPYTLWRFLLINADHTNKKNHYIVCQALQNHIFPVISPNLTCVGSVQTSTQTQSQSTGSWGPVAIAVGSLATRKYTSPVCQSMYVNSMSIYVQDKSMGKNKPVPGAWLMFISNNFKEMIHNAFSVHQI